MKVALVLTGHLRCWRYVLPNTLATFGKYNPDIFIHTWDEEGWWIPGDKHNTKGYHENTPMIDYSEITGAYRPARLEIEKWDIPNVIFEARGKDYPKFAHRPKNILSMFYKLHHGVSMMNSFSARHGKEYDLVVRMRPDMIINQDLRLEDFDPGIMFTIPHRNHLGQGTGDLLQISGQTIMSMFAMLPIHMDRIYKGTDLLCPHVMTKAWIDHLHIPHKEFHLNKIIQHTPKGEYVEMKNWKNERQTEYED